jgi:hypothetical protein
MDKKANFRFRSSTRGRLVSGTRPGLHVSQRSFDGRQRKYVYAYAFTRLHSTVRLDVWCDSYRLATHAAQRPRTWWDARAGLRSATCVHAVTVVWRLQAAEQTVPNRCSTRGCHWGPWPMGPSAPGGLARAPQRRSHALSRFLLPVQGSLRALHGSHPHACPLPAVIGAIGRGRGGLGGRGGRGASRLAAAGLAAGLQTVSNWVGGTPCARVL